MWNMSFTTDGTCCTQWNMFSPLIPVTCHTGHQLTVHQVSQHALSVLTESCCAPLCWWWWRAESSCSSSSQQTLAGASHSDSGPSSESPAAQPEVKVKVNTSMTDWQQSSGHHWPVGSGHHWPRVVDTTDQWVVDTTDPWVVDITDLIFLPIINRFYPLKWWVSSLYITLWMNGHCIFAMSNAQLNLTTHHLVNPLTVNSLHPSTS